MRISGTLPFHGRWASGALIEPLGMHGVRLAGPWPASPPPSAPHVIRYLASKARLLSAPHVLELSHSCHRRLLFALLAPRLCASQRVPLYRRVAESQSKRSRLATFTLPFRNLPAVDNLLARSQSSTLLRIFDWLGSTDERFLPHNRSSTQSF